MRGAFVLLMVAARFGDADPLAARALAAWAAPVPGCPRAHCDGANSDLAYSAAPPAGAVTVWHRTEGAGEQVGSRNGLGCSSNGAVAACSYAGTQDNVVAYDYDGNRLWASGSALNGYAYTSAPLILQDGSVIACDDRVVMRVGAGGVPLWQAPLHEGGIPISPVTTDDGSVVLVATLGGPVYAWRVASGELIGVLFPRANPADPGFFETVNTPAVRDNRLYVVGHHQVDGVRDGDGLSALIAIDVFPDAVVWDERLQLAWHLPFGGPSGASPLLIGSDIFFDAARPAVGAAKATQMLAVRDLGTGAALLWQRPAGGPVIASFARDPRPGSSFWVFTLFSPWIVRRAANTGAVVQAVNVDTLIGESGTHVPLSPMTIAGPAARPTLLIGATAFGSGASYATAVDLVSGGVIWKVVIDGVGSWVSTGQFPLLMRGDDTRVVFTTSKSGARAIGLPF